MRKRSPAELAALQKLVERGWNKRVTDPILNKALPLIEKIPEHPVSKPLKWYLRTGTKLIARDPVGIGALQFLPATGATEAYISGKLALEKLIDKLAPLAKAGSVQKRAFGVSEYSGPLVYGRFKQESYIPPFRSPAIKTAGPPSQKKVKSAEVSLPLKLLRSSQRVGKPRLSPPPGPSIAEIAKPKGFGSVLPGAGKGVI